MAHSLQAKKRVRQNIKRNLRNSSARSTLRTLIKRVRTAIAEENYDLAQKELQTATKYLDKKAHSGLIHANKAARHKSRLNAAVKALAPQPATDSADE